MYRVIQHKSVIYREGTRQQTTFIQGISVAVHLFNPKCYSLWILQIYFFSIPEGNCIFNLKWNCKQQAVLYILWWFFNWMKSINCIVSYLFIHVCFLWILQHFFFYSRKNLYILFEIKFPSTSVLYILCGFFNWVKCINCTVSYLFKKGCSLKSFNTFFFIL